MSAKRLAIAIPTFERSAALSVNLPVLLREAAPVDVDIYLSDDSRSDETAELVADLSRTHGNLHYRRNTPSFGHDKNVVETLEWPDTDYVWILGDVFRFTPGALTRLLGMLGSSDFVFVNWQAAHIGSVSDVNGDAAKAFLRSVLWHQALTGATVYSRQVIEWARRHYRTYDSNFPQLGIILGYADAHPLTISWLDGNVLEAERKTSYWMHRALDVFVDDWAAVVAKHPRTIPQADLTRVLRSHSKATQLFQARFLRELRESGHFNWKALRRPHFWKVMHLPPYKVLPLMFAPKPLLRWLLN